MRPECVWAATRVCLPSCATISVAHGFRDMFWSELTRTQPTASHFAAFTHRSRRYNDTAL